MSKYKADLLFGFCFDGQEEDWAELRDLDRICKLFGWPRTFTGFRGRIRETIRGGHLPAPEPAADP
jgi:hypothetical protein